MKKRILVVFVALFAADAKAQTAAEVLAAANSSVCEKFSLSTGCTDAAVLTAWCTAGNIKPCVDSRLAEDKIYSTAASYATAVLLPPKQAEFFAKRKSAVVERLVRLVLSDPAKCATILTAAGLDTLVCK